MRISVVIPAYNAASTIAETVQSVLKQTIQPTEILILDDGSTDNTTAVLRDFSDRVRVIRSENGGVANARNNLCKEALGDLIAFLDADDLWHPAHLESHLALYGQQPSAVGCFTYHFNFSGYGNFVWPTPGMPERAPVILIPPVEFVEKCNAAPMHFQMSCGSITRETLLKLGHEPFRFSGGEDTFFHHRLALTGPIVHTKARTVAYRISPSSLSANRLMVEAQIVAGLATLEQPFRSEADRSLYRGFRDSFAARRRLYGKLLMSAGRTRRQNTGRSGGHKRARYGIRRLECRRRNRWPGWRMNPLE